MVISGNANLTLAQSYQDWFHTDDSWTFSTDNELIANLLIENGANVNSIDTDNWTPLHKSAEFGSYMKLMTVNSELQ